MPEMRPAATLLALWSALLCGQTITTQPQFDVASIKPSNPEDPHRSINFTGGAFRSTNHTLKDFIAMAWDVRPFQVSGGPGWIGFDKYDIDAKPSAPLDTFKPGGNGEQQVRPMIQSLLADRFRLKLHRETKEMRVYFLVVGKNGVNLKRTADVAGPGTSMHDEKGQLVATQIDMGILARELGGELEAPVIDKTNLNGAYDIKLEWNPDEDASASVSGSSPSIFTAVREQLGLKLESGRGPVEVLVVDHAEKASAN